MAVRRDFHARRGRRLQLIAQLVDRIVGTRLEVGRPTSKPLMKLTIVDLGRY